MFLPLLLAGVVTSGNYAHVEQALSDGIRKRVEQGWAVIDVRTASNSNDPELQVTLSKGETFERHVVTFASTDAYSIETDVKAPVDGDEPSHYLNAALAAPGGGGVELQSSCGEYFLRPYMIDEQATGEFASALVTRTLATSDNLANASTSDGVITFSVTRKQVARELVVWLDRKGTVIEAQLRRFEWGGNGAEYTRMAALKKQLAKTRVVAIKGTTLILPKSTFVLDPEGSAFYEDDGDHGCGC
jgi:hypothetical protein